MTTTAADQPATTPTGPDAVWAAHHHLKAYTERPDRTNDTPAELAAAADGLLALADELSAAAAMILQEIEEHADADRPGDIYPSPVTVARARLEKTLFPRPGGKVSALRAAMWSLRAALTAADPRPVR